MVSTRILRAMQIVSIAAVVAAPMVPSNEHAGPRARWLDGTILGQIRGSDPTNIVAASQSCDGYNTQLLLKNPGPLPFQNFVAGDTCNGQNLRQNCIDCRIPNFVGPPAPVANQALIPGQPFNPPGFAANPRVVVCGLLFAGLCSDRNGYFECEDQIGNQVGSCAVGIVYPDQPVPVKGVDPTQGANVASTPRSN